MLGVNMCLTVGSSRVRLSRGMGSIDTNGQSWGGGSSRPNEAVVFDTETATSAPPRLLTLRGNAVKGGQAKLQACVHGARVSVVPDAFKVVDATVKVLQA